MTNENDGYDAAENGAKCYTLAIRMLRLEGIKQGKFAPRLDDAEEMEAAREAGFHVVEASAHRRSA